MRLIGSSEPAAVDRARAIELLEQRVMLATAVVRELQKTGGEEIGGRSRAALDLLRGWVAERYDGGAETHAGDGLAGMVVPAGYEETMTELTGATEVCEALAMAWTADTQRELDGDRARIRALLAAHDH